MLLLLLLHCCRCCCAAAAAAAAAAADAAAAAAAAAAPARWSQQPIRIAMYTDLIAPVHQPQSCQMCICNKLTRNHTHFFFPPPNGHTPKSQTYSPSPCPTTETKLMRGKKCVCCNTCGRTFIPKFQGAPPHLNLRPSP